MYMILTSGTGIEEVAATPVISMKRGGIRGWDRVLKDMEDYVLSAVGLLLLSPLFLLVAVLIKLDSKGPVFYRQERVGKNGKRFMIYKFRSMVADAERVQAELLDRNEAEGPIFKMRHDPRITRVGAVIRKTSIDELPQLINVVLGHMSLVGPRPPIPKEVAQYEEWQKERLSTTPGITGLWQISGRSDLTFEEMVKWDIYYIHNWSLWLDIKILLKTVPVVLFGRGAY
jgi:exopolysaccharide biosynthesis polyprenyl glycosylphosphotransferase